MIDQTFATPQYYLNDQGVFDIDKVCRTSVTITLGAVGKTVLVDQELLKTELMRVNTINGWE
jgi:hypothetical protein